MCCDLLSNLYLWHIKYSHEGRGGGYNGVVICFQICIFDILNTAVLEWKNHTTGCDLLSNLYLWHIKYSSWPCRAMPFRVVICFQICIFDILNTANVVAEAAAVSCDLLSNLYLWHIKYSVLRRINQRCKVVICFQICIFDILNTAVQAGRRTYRTLWFAFKFVSLTY